ncbi:(4Fe-4S)-binding protein [Nocardiopsis dassonvillei]|uniref:ferredoxin n=1 Tax=Nocardiopsis dassonvillei TaxID=2014 RepID=UPI0020A5C0AB|nr:(4Fe-4S)-binding protein [Nocardiopsis dassonvillei]MCP3016877.1 (4Fe-4S)-binding protein [Nocardiopsis dassonvillei]
MRITVHPEVCIGAGQCVVAADRVFDQGEEDGLVRLRTDRPDPRDHAHVRNAVDRCPSGAIELTSD